MATKRAKSSKGKASSKRPTLTIVETPKAARPITIKGEPVAILPGQAILAPELRAQIQEKLEPVMPAHVSAMDERARAREERRQKKQAEIEELRRRRERANLGLVTGTIPSTEVEEPLQLPDAPQVTTAPTPQPGTTNQVHIVIPEALKYKLLYVEGELKQLSDPIRQVVKLAAQAKLLADIRTAIENNEGCKAAQKSLQDCANEVLKSIKHQIPEGYIPVYVATKEGVVVCRAAPPSKKEI